MRKGHYITLKFTVPIRSLLWPVEAARILNLDRELMTGSVPRKHSIHNRGELVGEDGVSEKLLRPKMLRPLLSPSLVKGRGEKNHRNARSLWILFQGFADLKAVSVGKIHIEDDQVGLFFYPVQRLCSVGCFSDGEARVRENALHGIQMHFIVIYGENCGWAYGFQSSTSEPKL